MRAFQNFVKIKNQMCFGFWATLLIFMCLVLLDPGRKSEDQGPRLYVPRPDKRICSKKSNELISHHILQNQVKNLTKSNKILKNKNKKQSILLTEVNCKMISMQLQIHRMKQDILEIKRDRKKKMKKNIVAVKSENLNPEDYIFENEKVKTGDVQLLMNEIKTEHG